MRGPEGANAKVPLGQLPILELPNGEVICQSHSLLRWAGKHSDLYPSNFDQAAVCDELLDSLGEIRGKMPESKDPVQKKALREEYVKNDLKKYLNYLSRRIEHYGGPYLLGKHLTIPDLVLYRFVQGIYENKYDHVTKDHILAFPLIAKHHDACEANEIVKRENEAEQKAQQQQKKH